LLCVGVVCSLLAADGTVTTRDTRADARTLTEKYVGIENIILSRDS